MSASAAPERDSRRLKLRKRVTAQVAHLSAPQIMDHVEGIGWNFKLRSRAANGVREWEATVWVNDGRFSVGTVRSSFGPADALRDAYVTCAMAHHKRVKRPAAQEAP